MSEVGVYSDIGLEVEAAVAAQQERSVAAAALAGMSEDARILGQTTTEYLLAQEVGKLDDRLIWLAEHPRARHFSREVQSES